MAVSRWEPTNDVMRPFLDNFFSGLDRFSMSGLRMPITDVVETENEIRVEMEVPGLRVQDINVELEGHVLTISGEKKEMREEKQGTQGEPRFHLSERRWGSFTRSFVLPREVKADRIQADYSNGLLMVTIPKAETARRRRIDVGQTGGRKRVDASTQERAA